MEGGLPMVVYLDTLVLLNLLLDYLLLLLTGRILGNPLFRWKLALAAAFGALYAALPLLFPTHTYLQHPLVILGVGALMVLIAYGSAPRLLRSVLIFYALSAALGGGLYALRLMGVGPVTLDLKAILFFAAIAYCVLSLAGRKLARHGPGELQEVVIRLGERSTRFTALVDSGNTLSDPMTGKGVLVAEGDHLRSLLPPEVDYSRPAQCFPILQDPKRFRLLPYRSVGVDQGLLLAVRADSVRVNGQDLGPRLVALSPTPVSDSGNYQALISME